MDEWWENAGRKSPIKNYCLLQRIQKQPRKIIVLSCVDWWIVEQRRKKICHQSPLSPAKNSKNPRKGSSSIKSEDNAFLSTLEATDVELLAKIVEPPSSKEVPDVYIVKYPEGLLESQNSETESSTAGMFMPNGVVLAETDDNSFGSQCVIFTGFWGQQPFQYGHYKLSSHSE